MALRMIKDVIRLKWEAQLSHESIAAALGVSKGAVAKYLGLASAAGLDWETVREWDERRLAARLLPRAPATSPFVEPDWGRVHRELDRKGVTLMLLWEEYVAAHPHERTWRYTQFCEHYKAFARRLKRSMRQHRRAGEKLFIDFAGPAVALHGGGRAQVFVAALGASSYTFACATGAQKLEDWVECMVRALAFYGGVPQLIVPDNARAVIADPNRYEPRAADTVRDLAVTVRESPFYRAAVVSTILRKTNEARMRTDGRSNRDSRAGAGRDAAAAKADRLANGQADAVSSALVLGGARTSTRCERAVDFAVLRAARLGAVDAAALECAASRTRCQAHGELTA